MLQSHPHGCYWAQRSASVSLLPWEAQDWTQHSRCASPVRVKKDHLPWPARPASTSLQSCFPSLCWCSSQMWDLARAKEVTPSSPCSSMPGCAVTSNERRRTADWNDPISHFSLTVVVTVGLFYSCAQGHLPGHRSGPTCVQQANSRSFGETKSSVTAAARPEFSQHFYYHTWCCVQPSAKAMATPCRLCSLNQAKMGQSSVQGLGREGVSTTRIDHPAPALRALPAKIFH